MIGVEIQLGPRDSVWSNESIRLYRFYRSTRSKLTPRTDPPAMEERTFRLKPSRLVRRSSAASLFRGSEAFGSRKRNCESWRRG